MAMLNSEIAKLLNDIADIQELLGVQWKPRAYYKAAQAVEALSEAIEDIYKKGGIKALEEIPGIGEGIAKKIAQYIDTGKINELEKLKAKVPPGLSVLISIESIGPKKAVRLWKELKIKDISDLKKAISQHKIAKLQGFGKKSEENISAGIGFFEKSRGRFLLGEILPVSQAIISRLKRLPEVQHISEAGSLRRRKETIGDLDILITIKKPSAAAKVMDSFTTMPEVSRVLAKGATKSVVMLKNGLQADVRVIPDNVFGAALQYFTGNVEHNVALRKIAIEKGYKLSEYGLFNRKTNKLVAGKTEEDVYKKLGLRYIEPELRENTGEIEAARKGKLPRLINLKDIKGDFHIHTNWSDGLNSIEQMIESAKKLGYEYIALTDHSKSDTIAKGMDEKRLEKYISAVRTAAKKYKGIKVLTGAEVYIKADGTLDYSDNILKKLDIVFASIHRNFKMPSEQMTKRILKAMSNKYVDVFSHPTTREINIRGPINFDKDKVFKFCADNGKILEINASPIRLDLNYADIREAIKAGCKLCINTDAHSISELNYMPLGIATARRGWAEAKGILNTRSLKELPKFLHKLK